MEKIDFVITWVDGNDEKWQKEKKEYSQSGDNRINRFRDWDNLRYWFRGVEKYAPWVNKIFFVTYGHLPEWLDISNPKLEVVKHSDYIPERYLPTFSSRTIDMNFHRISNLSEHFVYFNDDMFILRPVSKTDFFVNGLPRDTAILNAICFGYDVLNAKNDTMVEFKYTAPAFDMFLINRYFKKNDVIKRNFTKWFNRKYGLDQIRTVLLAPWRAFPGFMNYHLPYSYKKSTYQEVWDLEEEILDSNCLEKFRTNNGMNHWVFTYWQLAKGDFYPRNPKIGKSFWIHENSNENTEAYNAIRNQSYKLICLNDSVSGNNFNMIKEELNNCFEDKLNESSSFEK